VVCGPTRPRSRQAGVHRRDLGLNQHGAPLWSRPARRAIARRRPAWPLENDHLRVAGLRLDGVLAPLVLDGPINAAAFEAYVEQFLAPTLLPGDIVVIDNLSRHKAPNVRALIEAVGANLLYHPPYSPDFNPIEKLFSKLRPCCEKPPSEPSAASGASSANASIASPHANAQTISRPQATSQAERKPL